ncbi:MAG: hypothetical protein ACOX20_06410 [Limnochordia bacterium]
MKRLHKTCWTDILDWQRARMEAGQAKYGDAHMERYGLVDIVEELLDALNILELAKERWGTIVCPNDRSLQKLLYTLRLALRECVALAEMLPDGICTDEAGGKRIWWSSQQEVSEWQEQTTGEV